MMRKLLPITALVLGLSSGVALADPPRSRGDGRYAAPYAPHVARPYRGYGGDRVVRDRPYWHNGGRVVVRGVDPRYGHRYDHRYGDRYGHRYVRRPIYVSRPVIRERYYDYYRRPALIAEHYDSRSGYYWLAGQWIWSGYEWIWQPGHYEPDPSYVDPGYDDGYYRY